MHKGKSLKITHRFALFDSKKKGNAMTLMTLALEQKFPRLLSEAQSFTNQMVEHFLCLKMSLDEENGTILSIHFQKKI